LKRRGRALLLCPEPPLPATGGGPLRTASLLAYLAQNYTLDAIFFREEGANDPAQAIPRGLLADACTITLPRHSKTTLARAVRNIGRLLRGVPPLNDRFGGEEAALMEWIGGRQYDLGMIEHFWCAGYLPLFRRCCEKVGIDLHNIESVLWKRTAATMPVPVSFACRYFGIRSRGLERRLLPGFDFALATSPHDAELIDRLGARQVCNYPNSLPDTPVPEVRKDHSIVFSGNLEYAPNIAAVRFFAQRIWPGLRERAPGLVWRIVGKNPGAVEHLVAGQAGIELTGPVEDAIPVIARSLAAVVPLLSGSGTRIKILEAWAAGTPVVATSIGAEGLHATPGKELLIANDAADFARDVWRLVESADVALQIAYAGRQRFDKEYTWRAAWDKLEIFGL